MAKRQISTVLEALKWELGGYRPRFILSALLLSVVPPGWGPRIRTLIYRGIGWSIGPKTLIMGSITLIMPDNARHNIHIGANCFINSYVTIDAGARVMVGDGVAIGHHVVIITANHDIGPPQYRAGDVKPCPVTIEGGAWIASGVTILPGVTIGAGAIVAAGAVVTRNVLPNTVVAGIPAKVIRILDGPCPLDSELELANELAGAL